MVPVKSAKIKKRKHEDQKFDREDLTLNIGVLVRPSKWYDILSRLKMQVLTQNLVDTLIIRAEDFLPGNFRKFLDII